MTILKPLAIFALTPILLNMAVNSSLTAQLSAAPQSALPQDPFGGGRGPSVNWQVELTRNQEALQKQSEKIAAQLTRLIDLQSDREITIEQYVEMIQEAQGAERLNVLIAEELRNTRLPSFNLHGIRVSAALQILPRLAGNDAITVEIESAVDDETADLISISRDHSFTSEIGVQTHPIKRILDTIKPEILLQTLERGIQFSEGLSKTHIAPSEDEGGYIIWTDAGSPKVQIALEAETGLLFVKGTPAQLDVVSEILHAIEINNFPVIGGLGATGKAVPSPNSQPTPPANKVIE